MNAQKFIESLSDEDRLEFGQYMIYEILSHHWFMLASFASWRGERRAIRKFKRLIGNRNTLGGTKLIVEK